VYVEGERGAIKPEWKDKIKHSRRGPRNQRWKIPCVYTHLIMWKIHSILYRDGFALRNPFCPSAADARYHGFDKLRIVFIYTG